MNWKLILIAYVVYLVIVFLGATYEGHDDPSTWVGNTEVGDIRIISNINNAVSQQPLFGSVAIPLPNGDFFGALFRVITLQSALFDSDQPGIMMFRWFILVPITVCVMIPIFTFGLQLLRGIFPWV